MARSRGDVFPLSDLRVALRMWAHVAYVEGGAYDSLVAGAARRAYDGREADVLRWERARDRAFLWQRAWETLATCRCVDVEALLVLIDGVAEDIPVPDAALASVEFSDPDPALNF